MFRSLGYCRCKGRLRSLDVLQPSPAALEVFLVLGDEGDGQPDVL